jgi:hypothetical protein
MANEIQQPRPYDLVGNPILVAGIGSGFEATLQFRIHDGHDERTGHFNVGGGTGEHGQFQLSVDVAGAAFQLDRLFVEIYEESAKDGSEINKVIRPGHLWPPHRQWLYWFSGSRREARRHALGDRKRQLWGRKSLQRYRAGKPADRQ